MRSRTLGWATAVLLAAACGGGGGEPTTVTEPREGLGTGPGARPGDRPEDRAPAPSDPQRPMTVIVDSLASAVSMVADERHVYWTDLGSEEHDFADGAVHRVARVGGGRQTVARDQTAPTDLTRARGGVFWTNAGTDTVARYDLAKRDVSVLASAQIGVGDLMGDGDDLYWVKGGIVRAAIVHHELATGTTRTLHTIAEHPLHIAHGDGRFVWVTPQDQVVSIPETGDRAPELLAEDVADEGELVVDLAVTGDHVVWAIRGALVEPDRIVRMPVDGGDPEVLVVARGDVGHLVAQGDVLYYADSGIPKGEGADGASEGRIVRIPITGGDPTVVAMVPGRDIAGLAVAGEEVYFADSGTLDFDTGEWRDDARILAVGRAQTAKVAASSAP